MLSLQAGMNARVDADWINSRYPYLRAVVVEATEAIEHHGWKWWKHQEKDLAQLQMELIDIWHFLLSDMLLRHDGDENAALQLLMDAIAANDRGIQFDGRAYAVEQMDLVEKLELLAAISVARRLELGLFAAIMADCGLDWTELYRQYVGKNVLNFFRQDRGYKEGSYQKTWNGREDNEYLVEILERLDAGSPAFKDDIYQALAQAYPSS